MQKETIIQKIDRRIWFEIRNNLHGKFYFWTFRTYWHYVFNSSKVNNKNISSYLAARPNIYAGIGHQMANWIAGYWFSEQFGLKFTHIPFSTDKWESFLGFGNGEIQYHDLIERGYGVRRLPKFDENNPVEIQLIRKIINSYFGKRIILLTIQDQFYSDKFLQAPSRKNDSILYDKNKFNIAVHVRRTVIIDGKTILENKEAQELRWLSNDYYEKVLKQVLENIHTKKLISIWLFSTGKAEEFSEFNRYGEVHFCSDMDEYQSFAHLIFADLLITSKSSFSYKPALMNDGIKICPRNFWHGYPDSKDWILCENDGTFNQEKLINLFEKNAK